MAKMMKPEAEIIRFGGIDVIATSGNFYALGSEVKQATGSGEVGQWYSAPTKDGTFSKVSGGFNNVNPEGFYVWYDEEFTKQWVDEYVHISFLYDDELGYYQFKVNAHTYHDEHVEG